MTDTKDTKLCPFFTIARSAVSVGEGLLVILTEPCLEDKCQMWRMGKGYELANPQYFFYCGLAGKP